MHAIEHNKRSIAKSITFRAVVMISDYLIIERVTHRSDVALSVIIFSNVSSTLLYYLHERAWAKTLWGKGSSGQK
jgi:uncharacterized membrane protein